MADASLKKDNNQEEPKVYAYRYVVLAVFGFCTCLNALAWIMYSPIFTLIEDAYGVSLLQVQYLSLSFQFLFLPFNFPSVIALEKYGLRVGVLIGIGLTAAGQILKSFINKSFALVMIG